MPPVRISLPFIEPSSAVWLPLYSISSNTVCPGCRIFGHNPLHWHFRRNLPQKKNAKYQMISLSLGVLWQWHFCTTSGRLFITSCFWLFTMRSLISNRSKYPFLCYVPMNDCADEISSTILAHIQLNGSFLLPLMLNTIDCLKWESYFH